MGTGSEDEGGTSRKVVIHKRARDPLANQIVMEINSKNEDCVKMAKRQKINSAESALTNKNLYDKEDNGPFAMIVETSIDIEGIRKGINSIDIARKLRKANIKSIIEIKKTGFNKVKIIFENYEEANKLVVQNDLKDCKTYIPFNFNSTTGILFDIPTEIKEEELFEEIISSAKIIKIIRINRKDGTNVFPTKRVKVIFKGKILPKELTLFYTKVTVKYYIPFQQCYNCWRFGHIAAACKERNKRCTKCYNKHEDDTPCKQVGCPNCRGEHAPNFKNCPARENEYRTKKS